MDKLNMSTPDLTGENTRKIEKLFPNVITEREDEDGNIQKGVDFDLLKQELSNVLVEDGEERYRLDWPGKKESILKANNPITDRTLRPDREESEDFDNTENLYLEGDNFEILKLLQESYLNKIKMIYIDPPYNTGTNFIYKDDFKQSQEDYDEETGAVDEDGNKLFKNTATNGRFHSDWLSMMYERLTIARDLLKDDGVIFISIDDNEQANLKKICDEIFGENNFIGNISVAKGTTTGQDAKLLGSSIDRLFFYSKNKNEFELKGIPLNDEDKKRFSYKDKNGKYSILQFRKTGSNDRREDRPNLFYPLIDPEGNKVFPYHPTGYESCWRTSKKTFKEWDKQGLILWRKNSKGNYIPYVKYYLKDRTKAVSNLWDDIEGNKKATITVNRLFEKKIFDFPKPVELIKRCIILGTEEESCILDFFAGSGSTAHAVMQQNAEDGGNRKFIMAQFPEETEENSEARKAGYQTISDIGKERIRRAAKKIQEDYKDKDLSHMDFGFRVFKTDSTNMKDVYYNPAELEQDMLSKLESNIKEDRSAEDLLAQVILDLGLELSLKIEPRDISGNKVFFVEENSLVACFDEKINFDIVDEIAKEKPLKVVFRDASFKDDKDRINVEERFKRLSPETKINVI